VVSPKKAIFQGRLIYASLIYAARENLNLTVRKVKQTKLY